MKTFSIKDNNKPLQFFTDCTGCILEPKKQDQIVVLTASGGRHTIGIQLPHDLSLHIYEQILAAAEAGACITIPDLSKLDDDAIRVAVDKLEIK